MAHARPGRRRGRPAAVAGAVAAAAVSVLLAAPAASAHPFGPPLNVRMNATSNEISVQWLAAEDDWVILGQHLDAFTSQTGSGAQQLTGAQQLAQSDDLPGYLLSHIGVEQDGQDCTGRVDRLDDLLAQGAHLVFSCPVEVSEVDLTVTALTDVNENYRTVVTSEEPSQPEQSLFTATTPTQHWSFDADGAASTATRSLAAAGGLVLVAVAGGVVWWRRSGRVPAEPAPDGLPPDGHAQTGAAR